MFLKFSQGNASIFMCFCFLHPHFRLHNSPKHNTSPLSVLLIFTSIDAMSTDRGMKRILHWSSQFKIDCFQLSAAVVNEESGENGKANEGKSNENKPNTRGLKEAIKYLRKINWKCSKRGEFSAVINNFSFFGLSTHDTF